jgi:hypothetical protein
MLIAILVKVLLYEKGIQSKLSGNEVYYTACSLPMILTNSCSKLHRKKGFNLVPFSYELLARVVRRALRQAVQLGATEYPCPTPYQESKDLKGFQRFGRVPEMNVPPVVILMTHPKP